ncbi:DUF2188 domain-containing protein [Sulfitobacter sp. SK011]|uniref:DUF2188 domain-containing protein n=1 Tax=Sulfitobacter sp. SK011 TaxID=1389004 RepID=UPI000E0B9854|nr:DUF2188 domain-containing protein [Sulfitobacter sp. SK011]AXI42744.1 hypothetical protein C1J02_12925 [Sulfitobacter sp. SK011]
MADKRDYWTQQRSDGSWESKREGASRASSVSPTQAEAWEKSKDLARDRGGEAYLKGTNGQIRERNTYGNDPKKSKG